LILKKQIKHFFWRRIVVIWYSFYQETVIVMEATTCRSVDDAANSFCDLKI